MTGYLEEFRNFDAFSKQSDSIAFLVMELSKSFPAKKSFVFADVGANEGVLTQKILTALQRRYESVHVYAFEPDELAYAGFKERFSSEKNVHPSNLPFESLLLSLSKARGTIDLLLNSHTFYHFHETMWEHIIRQSNVLLREYGTHMIVLDSNNPEFNDLKERIDKNVGDKLTIQSYGNYLTGNFMKNFLDSKEIPYQQMAIHHQITIPSDASAEIAFSRLFGFLFRYTLSSVLEYARQDISEFMGRHKESNSYVFPRCQDAFIINKF